VEPDTARRLVSSVHFDPNAAVRLGQSALETSDALNLVDTWPGQVKDLLKDKHGEQRRLGRFPSKAIIVKPAWYVIPQNPAAMTTREIHVWNGRLPSESGGGGPADSNTVVSTDFPDLVNVIVPSEDPCGSTGPPAQRAHSEVSLNDFFTLPICDKTLVQDINDLNPRPAYAKVGDYLLLLGFHVITGEIDDWVWSTFWWNNRPNTGPFSADRPQDLANSVWGHYLMNITLGPDRNRKAGVRMNNVFNPYLELGAPNGIFQDCFRCHQLASAPVAPNVCLPELKLSIIRLTGAAAVTDDRVRTEFLWSIARETAKAMACPGVR
jgi:hypothetical protein